MGSIKVGAMRHRITLTKPSTVVNEKGRRITIWEPVATIWAAVRDVTGREFYVAQANHAEDVVTFSIRWRNDVDASWRLVHDGTSYDILEVNHLGYIHDYLQLKCRAVQGEGV